MKTVDQLLVELADALPEDADGGEASLRCAAVEFTLPLESLLDRAVGLRATVPRGLAVTGFQLPLGSVQVRFGRVPT